MKPIRIITPMLAAVVVVITSCSAPRLAQKSSDNDDVYNSVAKAQEYVQPDPAQTAQYQDGQNYDDNYGSSDPNYDMDYSSRINRFYYGSPYRNYYDPYYGGYGSFYSGLSPYSTGWSIGFGWGLGSYYNSIWNDPFYGGWGYGGWGGFYSPFYGGYNPYWGGGYWGGGYWGGGYWGGGWGGGYYGNRLPGNTTYGARPYRGRENGTGYTQRGNFGGNYNGNSNRRGATVTRDGVVYSDRNGRTQSYTPNRGNIYRGDRGAGSNPYVAPRPNRSESYTPQRDNRPTYTPPPSGGGDRGSYGGGGGGGRTQRGGRN